MSGPIRTIAVVGDGIAGWLAAATFSRRLRGVSVRLVPVADLSSSMADLFGGTPPSASDFHADIGLNEVDVVLRTGGAYRLGTLFREWAPGRDFVHAFGPAGIAIDGLPFAPLWAAARKAGQAESFDRYHAASLLGRLGRFLPGGSVRDPLLNAHGHGLQLRPEAYRAMVADYARRLGTQAADAPLREALLGERGIAALVLANGERLEADLYVDATNAEARLIGNLAGDWETWSHWLPCDSMLTADGPAPGELPSLDEAVAVDGGWCHRSVLPDRSRSAIVYSRSALDDHRASHILRDFSGLDAGEARRFASGRRKCSWSGNVVAIGEASVILEPLEAVPMHILFAQLDRIVTMLPDRGFADVEIGYYNREAGEEADRLRDLLIAHYVLADRREPFWRSRSEMALPALLAETLRLFLERGRLPIRDHESFSRDDWQAVLFGHGVVPHRLDPIVAGVEPGHAARSMERHRQQLDLAVASAPSHRDFLTSLARRMAS